MRYKTSNGKNKRILLHIINVLINDRNVLINDRNVLINDNK